MSTPRLLDQLLRPDGIEILLQPIVDVSAPGLTLHGCEALTRGPIGTNLAVPQVLFEYVRRRGAEGEIDRRCSAAAIATFASVPEPLVLSLNVHATTLERDTGFAAHLAGMAQLHGIRPERLVVEIVEHSPYVDAARFVAALERLRDLGIRVALDDIGLGHSNYRMVLDCRPQYFKIDRYFVRGASRDEDRRAVLESIVRLARRFDAWVVAEGVETPGDLEAVTAAGVTLAQGYLFARPLSREELFASWSALAPQPTVLGVPESSHEQHAIGAN